MRYQSVGICVVYSTNPSIADTIPFVALYFVETMGWDNTVATFYTICNEVKIYDVIVC